MPIYEYQCQQCGHRSEEMQRLADAPLTVCPSCGGPYQKQISAPAFQFKGSGWYVTDYAKGGAKGGARSGDEGGSGKSEDSGGSKSEDISSAGKAEKVPPAESGGKADSKAGAKSEKPAAS